jgi:hypothetical protein
VQPSKRMDVVRSLDGDSSLHHKHDLTRVRRPQDIKRARTLAAYQMHHQLDSDGVDALTTPHDFSSTVDKSSLRNVADSVGLMLEKGYVRSQLRARVRD